MNQNLLERLCHVWRAFADSQRNEAVALTEFELSEMENIFSLLLMGSFVGMPSPPSFLAVELLPLMERELKILNIRAEEADDMFAEMVGLLGID